MVWKRNSSPSLFPYALYISSSVYLSILRAEGAGGGGQNDPIIARKHGSLPLLPLLPYASASSQFSPNLSPRFFSKYLFLAISYGEKKRISFLDIGDTAKD